MVASLPSGWREQAGQVGERLHIDPLDWYRTQDSPRFLREVAQAVWQARRLSVDYESWQGPVQRDLEPLGLVLKAGAWYLVARAVGRDGVRTYRLASMIALKTTGRSFKRPRGFDLARTWQESAARFEAELRKLQARVSVSPRGLVWFGNARIPVIAVTGEAQPVPGRPGWREVLMPIESIEHGARQLLGFGAEVEVLEPAELRDQVRQQASQLLALYPGPGGPPAASPARAKAPARR
jgi:predicted DNA-binding transcriptional regulator YafY